MHHKGQAESVMNCKKIKEGGEKNSASCMLMPAKETRGPF